MKAPKKQKFSDMYFSHILVIGLATAITLVVMVTFVMTRTSAPVIANPTNVQSVQASSPSVAPEETYDDTMYPGSGMQMRNGMNGY